MEYKNFREINIPFYPGLAPYYISPLANKNIAH